MKNDKILELLEDIKKNQENLFERIDKLENKSQESETVEVTIYKEVTDIKDINELFSFAGKMTAHSIGQLLDLNRNDIYKRENFQKWRKIFLKNNEVEFNKYLQNTKKEERLTEIEKGVISILYQSKQISATVWKKTIAEFPLLAERIIRHSIRPHHHSYLIKDHIVSLIKKISRKNVRNLNEEELFLHQYLICNIHALRTDKNISSQVLRTLSEASYFNSEFQKQYNWQYKYNEIKIFINENLFFELFFLCFPLVNIILYYDLRRKANNYNETKKLSVFHLLKFYGEKTKQKITGKIYHQKALLEYKPN